MKYIQELKQIFEKIISESDMKLSNKNRKLSEADYFEAYLIFCNNSIHYRRFTTVIKGEIIKGKYLNHKVNKWTENEIFSKLFLYLSDKYEILFESDSYHIDGKIITNKGCNEIEQLGRNVKYKSKQSINIQTVVDEKGIPL